MSVNVNFQLGQFPEGFCFQTPQQYADALVAILQGQIGGNFSGVIISTNAPQVTDQDKLWVKIDATGRPVGTYIFKGAWLWPHPKAASGSERMIWVGSESDLWAYDGGDGSDPATATSTTGAIWQRDTNFDFKFPVGAGTNATPYDSNPASVINPGDTGGEERHELLGTEVGGDHVHAIGKMVTDSGAGGDNGVFITGTATPALSGTGREIVGNANAVQTKVFGSTATGSDLLTTGINNSSVLTSHQNMPPFVGVYFAKRTARVYLTAS